MVCCTRRCVPSGRGRNPWGMDDALLDAPLRTAEFLAVDTETNGRGGDACELTEAGAVLVGGGELHERWSSLVQVQAPLGRTIQRFTGISQAMVDDAPDPRDALPALAARMEGRVLVAHNAAFDRRVLAQAFARAGIEWPDPPVLCTVALARRLLPLQGKRGLATLAASLGVEVEQSHRALPDAETCARVLCALFGKLCAHATTIGEALRLLRPRKEPKLRPARRGRPAGRAARAAGARLRRAARRSRRLPVPRRAREDPLRRQVGRRALARQGPLRAVGSRRRVDRAGRDRRLRAGALRARGAAAREPPGQAPPPAGQRAPQARGPGVDGLPPRRLVPRARGRRRAGARPRDQHRSDARPAVGERPRRRAHVAVRPAPLRPPAGAARAPVAVRADGSLPVALPRRSRPQRVPSGDSTRRSRRSGDRATPGARCSDASRTACARRRASAPTSGPPPGAGGATGSSACSIASTGRCARPTSTRGSCSPATRRAPPGTRCGWRAAA